MIARHKSENVHASCFALDGCGVLLCGAAGSGKSSLTLYMVEQMGADFVGDDRIDVEAQGGVLVARPAAGLEGLLHIHALGIERRTHLPQTRLALVVELVSRDDVPPIAPPKAALLLGLTLPLVQLCGFDRAAPLMVQKAVQSIAIGGFPADDGILPKP